MLRTERNSSTRPENNDFGSMICDELPGFVYRVPTLIIGPGKKKKPQWVVSLQSTMRSSSWRTASATTWKVSIWASLSTDSLMSVGPSRRPGQCSPPPSYESREAGQRKHNNAAKKNGVTTFHVR